MNQFIVYKNINKRLKTPPWVVFALFISTPIYADTSPPKYTFSVKPTQCIALNQGRVCFQNITFIWTSDKTANYCIYHSGNNRPLKCWEKASSGTIKYNFQSAENARFYLAEVDSQYKLLETEVTVAWVYKSHKQSRSSSGWRLF